MVMGTMTMNEVNLQTLEHTSFKKDNELEIHMYEKRNITVRGYQGESYEVLQFTCELLDLDIKKGLEA